MEYEECTASELARALEEVAVQTYKSDRGRTFEGSLLKFEPILYAWATAHPQLVNADKAFALARLNLKTKGFGETVWHTMQETANSFAKQLYLLGNIKLKLCKAQTHNGECDSPIKAGSCPIAWRHI